MTRDNVLSVIMLIATNLAMLKPNELTKVQSNFRRALRKMLNKIHKHERLYYEKIVKETNDAWNKTITELEKQKLQMSISDVLLSLNLIIENENYTKKFYTQRTVNNVLNSLKANSNISDEIYKKTEKDTNIIVNTLVRHLNIKVLDNGLRRRFLTIKNNLIIEGKIK